MSLRTRVIALLVALATGGMLVLAGITYASQRSFENARVNEQTASAEPALNHQLDDKLGITRGPGGYDGGPSQHVNAADVNLPPGVYGQRRSGSGAVLASAVISYGEASSPAPKLPAALHPGQTLTVAAISGDGHYRVRVFGGTDGTITIVAVPLAGVDAAMQRLLLVEALVIAIVLLLLAGIGAVLVRIELRPLERIGATADAIAAGDLDRRVEVGNSRTELCRMGAVACPEERERVMRRIEDEAARMGVLVEDLLHLARLDEIREVDSVEVTVSSLLHDAAADTVAMDPTRDVDTSGIEDFTVLGDENQLRQVLANLVRNAVIHTPAGTPIELSAHRTGDRVAITVRDHGPGLPTSQPDELFERFWRSEGGRERGKAGAGLGLAIVAGITRAHGGTVTAANVPDGGAVFTLELPLVRTLAYA